MLGYKCFNENLTNRYNTKFEIGKIYHVNGNIKFGNNGNGFHICKNLEDTLRYFNSFDYNISICLVYAFGKYDKYNDEYYGFYDMYAYEYLTILKKLNREEIINYALNLNEIRIQRFLSLYKLSNEEIKLFKNKFNNFESIIKCISYYQENNKDVYKILKK